ncbi:MAG: hypothetical protein QOH29_952, partial [Actinomycetota bacterium]|nr:hypothetical protein [Actinomycetota bacterium]
RGSEQLLDSVVTVLVQFENPGSSAGRKDDGPENEPAPRQHARLTMMSATHHPMTFVCDTASAATAVPWKRPSTLRTYLIQ